MARANMSGGTKSSRLIAEAMGRRGHHVNMCFVALPRPWPRPWHVARFTDRLVREVKLIGRQRHHLEQSTVNLIPVKRNPVLPQDVPDADVCVTSWWAVRQNVETWPASKGIRVHLIRDYEALFGDAPEQVASTYTLPGVHAVISGWLGRIMRENFGRDPVVVPNGVDWEQFQSVPRAKGAAPTIGMLYGNSERKRPWIGFEAVRLVQREIPDARLICFGRDPIEPRHQPPANVQFHLRPQQEAIPRLYQSTDVWLTPSRQEGFGMPGLEAAACRCPIVSTRCGGPEDYVHEGVNGYLVPVDDPQAMAGAILKILRLDDTAWRAMSQASHDTARDFSWDRSAQKLEAALFAALGRADM
jgi:glycosyltransferase involved in cell wall biosynthesis